VAQRIEEARTRPESSEEPGEGEVPAAAAEAGSAAEDEDGGQSAGEPAAEEA
jgi:hypothetical protein